MNTMPPRKMRKKPAGSKLMRKVARQQAKKVILADVETKVWDGSLLANSADNLITANGFNLLLTDDYSSGLLAPNAISQGTNDAEYIGNEIMPIGVEIRYAIDIDLTITGDNHNSVTMLVNQGKGLFQPSALNASAQFSYTGLVTSPFSPSAVSFDDRYRVLKRRTVNVNTYGYPSVTGTFFIPMKKLRKIAFADGNGTIEANPLFMTFISDSTVAGHPQVRLWWRIKYKDA